MFTGRTGLRKMPSDATALVFAANFERPETKTGRIWVHVLRVTREHREYGKLLKEAGVLSLRPANRVFRGKGLRSFADRRKFYLDPDFAGGLRLYDGADTEIDFETETSRAAIGAVNSQPELTRR